MKKIVVFLLLGFASFALIAGNSSHAEDELVDLYPYDQQACLEGTNECTQTKVGTSNWTMEFAGHRYHFVRGAARYVKDFEDDNSDGEISVDEMPLLQWNAFAGLIMNDSDQAIILQTNSNRTDLTSVFHAKYSYFDETGTLVMFEDFLSTYYIHNDGTTEAPDWRLATQAEADAFDAAGEDADTLTPNTRNTQIRMALDDVDTDGYVLEPLSYQKWTNADVDTTTQTDPEDWSTIINGDGVVYDGNPVNVYIPSGWTVVSWGTNDRGTANPTTTQYIFDMTEFIQDETLAPAEFIYTPQPASFYGISALDDDGATAGVNIVVEYNGTITVADLSTYLDAEDALQEVSAAWINMFDTEGNIINSSDKLNYSLTISQDGTDLETIDFTYDSGTDSYTASAEVTVIDTSEFGAGYTATWMTTTPEGDETTATADIVIGVMPPKFAGVEDRFVNQSVFVDLLEGITADDGYGNDKTDSIEVSYPASLNPYNPFPGEYQIDLEFTHHVFIPGVNPFIDLNGTQFEFDGSLNEQTTNFRYEVIVYTDVTNFKTSSFGWSSSGVYIEVGGDGKVIRTIDRHNWDLVDENGLNTPANASGIWDSWLANLTLEQDGYLIAVGWGMGDVYTAAKALAFDEPVSFDLTYIADFNYDIVTTDSYMLTVDDMTAPILMVVNENYSFYAGEYDNVNDAILANVVAYDFTDAQDDLVKYVSNNGGLNLTTPGTYTVEVTVEDVAGHTDVQSFDIVVKEAMLTEADIEALIEDNTLSAADIQALIDASVFTEADIVALIEANVLSDEDVQVLIDAGVITEAQIQALIDASLPEDTGCGSAINGTSAIFATFSILLGAAAIFFIRKRR
jgi:hypothetical protein